MKHKFLITLLVISLLVTACASVGNDTAATPETIPVVMADNTIVAEGYVEPVQFAQIAFNTNGVVSEVLVQEGQPVRQGEPMIRLGGNSDTNYAAAQLELVTAKQALNNLINSSGSDLAQTVIDLKDAREAYKKAADYLHYLQTAQKVPQTATKLILIQTWRGYEYRYKTRNFKGPAPTDWIIEAENDLVLKEAKMDELQLAYDRMKDGADTDQLELLEARLTATKAKLASFTVTAPFDGTVAELNARQGSSINAGETAVTVADLSSWVVKTTDLTEIDVVELVEGDPVVVKLDAIPDVDLRGTILSISPAFHERQGDVVYEVTIFLADTLNTLRWGMTASVSFVNED